MEALIEFLQSPAGAHVKRVFFDDNGNWVFSPSKNHPHEKSVDELLAGKKAAEPKKVKVTKAMMKANPDWEAQGIKVGDYIEIPAEAIVGGAEQE